MVILAKTCGLQTIDAAQCAIDNGADLLGAIFVPGRSRTVHHQVAKDISQRCHDARLVKNPDFNKTEFFQSVLSGDVASSGAEYFTKVQEQLANNGPFLVGVFQNQSIPEIVDAVNATNLDIVQLHGSENKLEYVKELKKLGIPVISRYLVQDLQDSEKLTNEICVNGQHLLVLLDSAVGGEGTTLDWELIDKINANGTIKFMLAGGLAPDNVALAKRVNGVIGVDVSSGIETAKRKDNVKIEQFIRQVRE